MTLSYYALAYRLVHQVCAWYSSGPSRTGSNAKFDLAERSGRGRTNQNPHSPKGCDENGPAAALLIGHVSVQICSLVVRPWPDQRPILIATLLYHAQTWCTSSVGERTLTRKLNQPNLGS